METTPATPPNDLRRTLMTVHAHPDDETIGTGGVMAKAVADGHRVVLVTCTRGELGEIVDPELDTPANHRRLGEIRAGELEAAMGALGVTEWENLGYRDSGMLGEPGNHDPRSFWRADRDEAIGRLVWMVRRYRPDVITGYNSFGGYGHPDHVNAHRIAVGAFYRAGDPEWYPEQLAPEHGGTGPAEADGGLDPWAPAKLYEQATGRARREVMAARMETAGVRSFWSRPDSADAAAVAAWETFMRRSTADDEEITTRVDCARFTSQRWSALLAHRTQLSTQSPLLAMGPDALAELMGEETFILRGTRDDALPGGGPLRRAGLTAPGRVGRLPRLRAAGSTVLPVRTRASLSASRSRCRSRGRPGERRDRDPVRGLSPYQPHDCQAGFTPPYPGSPGRRSPERRSPNPHGGPFSAGFGAWTPARE